MKDVVSQYIEWQESPIQFIEDMWGLTPQPLKEEFYEAAVAAIDTGDWEAFEVHWFIPKTRDQVIEEKLITWQQWVILLAVERGLVGLAPKRVSVSSGHGIGKDATLAWLILWYLFCHKDAMVPCTAPSSDQMYDILWKELAVWLRRMPQDVQAMYEWSTMYLRMAESPETWFARAKTARKEAPEALAGIHADYVFMAIDEASGVAEEIFNTAEGALTNANIFVFMISNPTRLTGYFYESHHKFKAMWQCLKFDGRESPIVDQQFVDGIIAKHGEDSDEMKIRVVGIFADEDSVDDQGYVPLLGKDDLKEVPDVGRFRPGWARLGIDPAGGGKNKTVWVVRDHFRAKIVKVQDKSTGLSIAEATITIMDMFGIPDWQVTVDAFGEGIDAVQELALAGYRVNAINTGHPCEEVEDRAAFINIRAMISWRARTWIKKGSELVRHKLWQQCLVIRYRRQLSGKKKVMDKNEMAKQGIASPDAWDAFSLTFFRPENYERRELSTDDSGTAAAEATSVYNHR